MNRIRNKRNVVAKHTIREEDIVENSFWLTIERVGLMTSREYIGYMRGWPIRFAFETMCNKLMPYAKEKDIRKKVEESFSLFQNSLETYCRVHKVKKSIRQFLTHPENIRLLGTSKELKFT